VGRDDLLSGALIAAYNRRDCVEFLADDGSRIRSRSRVRALGRGHERTALIATPDRTAHNPHGWFIAACRVCGHGPGGMDGQRRVSATWSLGGWSRAEQPRDAEYPRSLVARDRCGTDRRRDRPLVARQLASDAALAETHSAHGSHLYGWPFPVRPGEDDFVAFDL